LGEGNVV